MKFKTNIAMCDKKIIANCERYYKRDRIITKCDKRLLQRVRGTKKCDNYYKVRLNPPTTSLLMRESTCSL